MSINNTYYWFINEHKWFNFACSCVLTVHTGIAEILLDDFQHEASRRIVNAFLNNEYTPRVKANGTRAFEERSPNMKVGRLITHARAVAERATWQPDGLGVTDVHFVKSFHE
ncbi:hypothetical protein CEXT_639301 [Caerostris extrusa]|uniref:Uncharacterized protein n=1 Tax=Caerostris extrusa TaxID=172846 RepID=A0AAV4WZX0_CAEEX|nr:hypothetical protein CEXT_639301 [Caerostris extrusa]